MDFLDVDFRKFEQYVCGDLGAQTFGWPNYEQRFGVMSDSEIEEAIDASDAAGGSLDLLVSRIYDQRQEGSCVANASCQAHEIVQTKQSGTAVQLSAISLYKRIGRSAQSGAIVSDGWKEMHRRGVLPLDTPENRAKFGDAVMPNTGFSRPFPANWEATAKLFAGLEAWNINSTVGLMTAVLQGHPVVVGRDGHSIVYTRITRGSQRAKVAKYANSWSEGWGDKGFGYDSMSKINEAARWAFALRSVRG